LRLPAIVDTFTCESLAARVDLRFVGDGVVRVLEGIAAEQDAPSSIRVDHGPEDRSEHLQQCDAQRIMVGLIASRTVTATRLPVRSARVRFQTYLHSNATREAGAVPGFGGVRQVPPRLTTP
jgi:hypothetical protein